MSEPYHPVTDYDGAAVVWQAVLAGHPVEKWDWDARSWVRSYADLRYQDVESGYWRLAKDNKQHDE